MEIRLTKKMAGVRIIEGFPGYGVVGTVTTEFLIDHLKCEKVGSIIIDGLQPMVAVHNNELVEPIGLFYDKENKLLILHFVTMSQGIEWEVTNAIIKLVKMVKAREIISVEGVGSSDENSSKTYYFSKDKGAAKKLKALGINPLSEGIIIGVTATVLVMADVPVTCIFSDTHTNLPDSHAAANIIGALDKYLSLNVDYKPLKETASKFEDKLRGIIKESQKAADIQEKKKMSYVG